MVVLLERDGAELMLTSLRGDQHAKIAVVIQVSKVDVIFREVKSRGWISAKKDSPVHQAPVNQTWGNREFYVDDPDGNTVRFVEFGTAS